MGGWGRYDGARGGPLTERHVQAIWYDRELRPAQLVTRSGESLRVIDPGRWNLAAGPDFRDAVLEIGSERRRLKGDVEVHLSPTDWCRHGHGTDPAYARVVAHVTWGCGPEPATLPSGAVSVWLGRFVTANVGFSLDQIDLSAYPFARLPAEARPCEARLRDDPDLAVEVLAEAGRHRLALKARRFRQLLAAPGALREQVFYQETMAALGYRCNARNFRRIAEAVPLAQVVAEPGNAEAALLAAGAFVPWCRGGLRPPNRPEIRLAAAAALFVRSEVRALVDWGDFSPAGCRAVVETLAGDRLMGRGRAAAVVANVILPLALAERRTESVPDWLPPEDLSEPVRLTAYRLFGRDHHPLARYASNGLLIQGLLQIHRDCCLQVHPDCAACPLVPSLVL